MPCPLPDHPGTIVATATAVASPGVLPVLTRDATLTITCTMPATSHVRVHLRRAANAHETMHQPL